MVDKHFSVIFNEKIKQFSKSINIDSDKSISQRSFIIASICEGVSKVENILAVSYTHLTLPTTLTV